MHVCLYLFRNTFPRKNHIIHFLGTVHILPTVDVNLSRDELPKFLEIGSDRSPRIKQSTYEVKFTSSMPTESCFVHTRAHHTSVFVTVRPRALKYHRRGASVIPCASKTTTCKQSLGALTRIDQSSGIPARCSDIKCLTRQVQTQSTRRCGWGVHRVRGNLWVQVSKIMMLLLGRNTSPLCCRVRTHRIGAVMIPVSSHGFRIHT